MGIPQYGMNKIGDSIDSSMGEILHVKAAADGTAIAGAETRVLTASDAGNRYIVDFSANTSTFRLPSAASSKGAIFHFHASIESDAENAKSLLVFTDAADEYIMGGCLDGGTIHDTSVADDELKLDGSGGAIGGGDRFSVVCDGKHWYVMDAVALTASAFVSGTATRS